MNYHLNILIEADQAELGYEEVEDMVDSLQVEDMVDSPVVQDSPLEWGKERSLAAKDSLGLGSHQLAM